MNEIWTKLIGINENYSVSNAGRLRRNEGFVIEKTGKKYYKKEHILSPNVLTRGYPSARLKDESLGKVKCFTVHRLVAKYFIPNPEDKPEVNHINGIKSDNRVENLEWVSHRDNAIHSMDVLGNKHKIPKGKNSGVARAVKCYDLMGNFIKEYDTITDASNELNILHQGIMSVLRGINGNCNGYLFKYSDDGSIVKPCLNPLRKPVICYRESGEFISEYRSAADAAREMRVAPNKVSYYCKNNISKPIDGIIYKYKY